LEPGIGQPGETGGVPDEPFVGGRPLQADHDDRGVHRPADAAGGQEGRDGVGNAVIEPELREFAQAGEVREAEITRQRRICPLGRDDQALGQPAPQRRRRKVDQRDLPGPYEVIRYRLGRRDPGDPGDDRAQRFDIGHVEGRIDIDAARQQLTDVLPAFGVPLPREVGVGQLIHHSQLWTAVQNRRDVQLWKARAPVGDHTRRKYLEIGELSSGRRPPVPLPVGNHGVGA
jgi:hypothetical protein